MFPWRIRIQNERCNKKTQNKAMCLIHQRGHTAQPRTGSNNTGTSGINPCPVSFPKLRPLPSFSRQHRDNNTQNFEHVPVSLWRKKGDNIAKQKKSPNTPRRGALRPSACPLLGMDGGENCGRRNNIKEANNSC